MDPLELSVVINSPINITRKFHFPGRCSLCEEEATLDQVHSCDSVLGEDSVTYKTMLIDCYNIQIQFDDKSDKYDICNQCAIKLKDAYTFKKKIEETYKNYKTFLYKCVNSKKIFLDAVLQDFKSEDDEPLCRLYFRNKIRTDVVEKLKRTDSVNYSNCSITRVKEAKKKSVKNKKSKTKINSANNEDIFNNGTVKDDRLSCSSVDSEDLNIATDFDRNMETNDKDLFIIPALQYSAKTCPICDLVPNSRQSLIRHYYDTHFPCFLCHLCGYGTTLRESFSSHMKLHRGVKYSCSICTKTFFSPISRYHHEKVIHKKIALFNCSLCESAFSHSVTRRKHLFEKHGVECLKYPCNECGKIFFSEYRLSVHVRRSHLHLRPFPCNQCSHSFFQNCDLRDHMTTHTGAKDFRCSVCGKCFSRRGCLKEHLKIHSNTRNFMCHLCHKTFIQKGSLKAHIKTHHKLNTSVTMEGTGPPQQIITT